jgi:hypothetical protein
MKPAQKAILEVCGNNTTGIEATKKPELFETLKVHEIQHPGPLNSVFTMKI